MTRSPSTGRSPTRSPPKTAARWIPNGCAWSARCISPRRASRPSRTANTASTSGRAISPASARSPDAKTTENRPLEALVEEGVAVVGTPDDAIAQIQRLQKKQGEFGCFLQLAHNWANFENTKKSYELWQRHVTPVDQRRQHRARDRAQLGQGQQGALHRRGHERGDADDPGSITRKKPRRRARRRNDESARRHRRADGDVRRSPLSAA